MTKKEDEKKNGKIRCSECGSTQNYIRFRDKKRVCRKCGHEENLEEKK